MHSEELTLSSAKLPLALPESEFSTSSYERYTTLRTILKREKKRGPRTTKKSSAWRGSWPGPKSPVHMLPTRPTLNSQSQILFFLSFSWLSDQAKLKQLFLCVRRLRCNKLRNLRDALQIVLRVLKSTEDTVNRFIDFGALRPTYKTAINAIRVSFDKCQILQK